MPFRSILDWIESEIEGWSSKQKDQEQQSRNQPDQKRSQRTPRNQYNREPEENELVNDQVNYSVESLPNVGTNEQDRYGITEHDRYEAITSYPSLLWLSEPGRDGSIMYSTVYNEQGERLWRRNKDDALDDLVVHLRNQSKHSPKTFKKADWDDTDE